MQAHFVPQSQTKYLLSLETSPYSDTNRPYDKVTRFVVAGTSTISHLVHDHELATGFSYEGQTGTGLNFSQQPTTFRKVEYNLRAKLSLSQAPRGFAAFLGHANTQASRVNLSFLKVTM